MFVIINIGLKYQLSRIKKMDISIPIKCGNRYNTRCHMVFKERTLSVQHSNLSSECDTIRQETFGG